MNPTNPIPAEALIEHQAFLRALARGLLADPEAAEDVVQETWLAALTRAPAAPDSLRAWLARVARNAALNLRRGERRRAARERASAREEAAPLESEVAERLAEQARVAEAVRALREPYRTTIILRYAEGLPPREVARRLGVPVETVRSQQKRGLAELRRRLERDVGGQRALAVVLARIARRGAGAPAPIGPVAAGATGTIVPLAVTAGLVAAVVIALASDRGEPAVAPRTARGPARVSLEDRDDATAAHAVASERSLASATRRAVPDEVAVPDGRDAGARGADDGELAYVLELDAAEAGTGALVARLEVGENEIAGRLDEGPPLRALFRGAPRPSLVARGERSSYELSVETADGLAGASARVHAVDPGTTPVRLRLAPRAALAGTVRDLSGAPVAGAIVRAVPADGRAREAVADARGRYRIGDLAGGAASLSARSRGCATPPVEVALRAGEASEHDLRLDALPRGELRGRLESRTGRPLGGAEVRLRTRVGEPVDAVLARAGSDGATFAFEALPAGEYELFAPADGRAWQPARLLVAVPGPEVVLVRRDEVPARPVVFRARDTESGEPIARLRVAYVVDPDRRGKRAALLEQGAPRAVDLARDEPALELARGADLHWVVEADGRRSAFGDASALARDGDALVANVRLEPSWRAELALVDARGAPLAVEGARLVTAGGRTLATSLADGRMQLELAYDPGELRLEVDGWRVERWEGFRWGKRRSELGVHRVWVERE